MDDQLSLALDLPYVPQVEQQLYIDVRLRIPFFGKPDQAQDFARNRLTKILETGVSSKVVISELEIT